MDQRLRMRFFCHQCAAEITIPDIAHVDMYVDVCWIQCKGCAEAFGNRCGIDRRFNPHPHGYLVCPYRMPDRRRASIHVLHTGERASPAGEPDCREGA